MGEFVIDKITQNLPGTSLQWSNADLSANNTLLADPDFHISQKIDMLLGCEIFYRS